MSNRRTTPNTSRESNVPSANPPQPTRLKPKLYVERREKYPWFNCENKYSKGHKCGEKKLFYIDFEEEEENDQESSQAEEKKVTTLKDITPTVSFHALAIIFTPQTLKIEGYIKHRKITMLFDSGSILISFTIN